MSLWYLNAEMTEIVQDEGMKVQMGVLTCIKSCEFGTHTNSNACNQQSLQSGTPAIRNVCNLERLQYDAAGGVNVYDDAV
jgi:hypothetical protein